MTERWIAFFLGISGLLIAFFTINITILNFLINDSGLGDGILTLVIIFFVSSIGGWSIGYFPAGWYFREVDEERRRIT